MPTHPRLPAPLIAPTLGPPNGFPRRRESRQELVVMQQTGAMRAAYPKPSWCCSPVSAFSVYTAHNKPNLPFSLGFCSAGPVWVSQAPRSDTLDARPFPCGARPPLPRRSPSAEPAGAGLPLTPREGERTRLDGPPRRGTSAELRSAASGVGEGRQQAEHREPGKSQCRPRRPSGKSAQAARGSHVPGRAVGRRRPREAALTAGCRRSALRLPSPAPRRRRAPRPRPPGPGGSENAERGRRRGIQAARRARPRAPRLGPERRGRCPAPGGRAGAGRGAARQSVRAGGRRAGQDRLGEQPPALSEGRVICATKFTQARPRFSSAARSSPLPRPRFYAPSPFF